MILKKNVLAIIPARGGSKGIPGKNIHPVAGKPLISYTIEAALASSYVDRVIVSTDDEKIAGVAREFGAEVPFIRPAELAQDTTPSLPVARHAVEWLKTNGGYRPDIVVLLQPVTPLRESRDIDSAVGMLVETVADSVIGLCEAEGASNPHWMRRMEEGRVFPFVGDGVEYTRRQDLPPVYHINGAITVVWRRILMEQNSFYGSDVRGYVMPRERSIDIDSIMDVKIAEMMINERNKRGA